MTLRRRTPLQAKNPCKVCGKSLCGHGREPSLKRTPIRPVNKPRRAKLFSEAFESEERVEWYRHQFCVVPGCDEGPCHVAHVRSRGAGGTADDAVPMCGPHHHESHQIGIRTYERKYGLDLEALAHKYASEWERWAGRTTDDSE